MNEFPGRDEIVELSSVAELAGDTFPFRGHPDLRGFTDDDYRNFSAGVYQKSRDARVCKWLGGADRVEAAKAKLKELGYTITTIAPLPFVDKWWSVWFEAKSIPGDYIPEQPATFTL